MDAETVELSGVMAFPCLAIRKAIGLALSPLGVRAIIFDRYKGPNSRRVILAIDDDGRIHASHMENERWH